MHSPVEEIKSRIDIVELLQSYIKLTKAGINYKANCPFHAEKTPSFFVSPTRQIWHCFGGCGEGGDIFKFIMKMEGADFPEALKLLAQRAGVILKREDPAIRSERNRLYDICEDATQIFEKCLTLTPAVKSYLKKRGVEDNTIKEFRLGFAPQSWDFLIKALTAKGYRKEDIEKAGLIIKSQEGSSWYDRFRSRIIFPIADANGRVLGFTGRVFESDTASQKSEIAGVRAGGREESIQAKYVNTPQTPIYDKSRVLYGFDKAKQEIRQKNQVVIVEGNMDCLMSHQAGVKHTIAVSGTALTAQHLQTLKRLSDTIVSSFDTDEAGDSATKRSLALASQFGYRRKIVEIPKGKDPADTILDDPKSWQDAVKNAKDVVTFFFDKSFRRYDSRTVEGKKAISSEVLPYVAELSDEIEKAHWVLQLAQKFGIMDDAVWKELNKKGSVQVTKEYVQFQVTPNVNKAETPTRLRLLEERILSLLSIISDETLLQDLEGRQFYFSSSINEDLFHILKNKLSGQEVREELKDQLNTFKFKGEVIADITYDFKEEFRACIREFEKECFKTRLVKLAEEIRIKEKEGNQVEVKGLLQDFRSLSNKLKILL